MDVFGGECRIAGVSGNGQQELGRIISGEDLRTDRVPKSIEMFGQSVTDKGVIERRDLGFSFVPEERLGRGLCRPCHWRKIHLRHSKRYAQKWLYPK